MGTVRYTVIDGEVIAEKRNGVRKQYVPDPLGSTVAMLDNTQTQTDTFSYWPYGEGASRTGTTPTPFQYAGTKGYHTNPTNVYVRARVLDVTLGKWITQDPIGYYAGDQNLYRYTGNQPTCGTDPTGLYAPPRYIGCAQKQKTEITSALNWICGQGGAAYRTCLSSHCGAPYPGGGYQDIYENPDPDQRLGQAGNKQQCVYGWCNTTVHPLTIICDFNWWSNKAGGRCNGGCGSTLPADPNKQEIVLCYGNIKDNLCDPMECGIAHELIHLCGQLAHMKGSFNCVSNIGKQCTKGRTVF